MLTLSQSVLHNKSAAVWAESAYLASYATLLACLALPSLAKERLALLAAAHQAGLPAVRGPHGVVGYPPDAGWLAACATELCWWGHQRPPQKGQKMSLTSDCLLDAPQPSAPVDIQESCRVRTVWKGSCACMMTLQSSG